MKKSSVQSVDDFEHLEQLRGRFQLEWDDSYRRWQQTEGVNMPSDGDLYFHKRFEGGMVERAQEEIDGRPARSC